MAETAAKAWLAQVEASRQADPTALRLVALLSDAWERLEAVEGQVTATRRRTAKDPMRARRAVGREAEAEAIAARASSKTR